MDKPNYYAVIPAEIRYSDIPPNAKLLYGEITALANKEGYCWASDSYFADLYGVSRETVNRWVAILVKCKFIRSEVTISDNMKKRKLYLESDKKVTGGVTKSSQPLCEKSHISNTSINNTINNNLVEIQSIYDLYCNLYKVNVNRYKLTPGRKSKIKARLEDAGKDLLEEAIKKTSRSAWHRGENNRGWKADLDFIIRNYEQVEKLANMEGQSFRAPVRMELNYETGKLEEVK